MTGSYFMLMIFLALSEAGVCCSAEYQDMFYYYETRPSSSLYSAQDELLVPAMGMFGVPVCLTLVHMTDAQQSLLREMWTHDLHTDGQTL